MRYRREDTEGDYTFGQGDDTFLIDSPECVAQAVKNPFRAVARSVVSRSDGRHAVCSVSAWEAAIRCLHPGYTRTHTGYTGRSVDSFLRYQL